MLRKVDPFFWFALFMGLVVLLFLVYPLAQMVMKPSAGDLWDTVHDGDVIAAIALSLKTACIAGALAIAFGTPLAYLLARRAFPGKRLVESIIDIPIMIPHPIVGIALISLAGRNHWIGRTLDWLGIDFMGSVNGIVTVLVFVGLPFYVNAVKTGIEGIPVRLENVARTLGASRSGAVLRVTLPLAWRSILTGFIMCVARAISEFGAVIIVAYHPMIAPVLIYERFTAYGLKYSQPVPVLLILVSLSLFVLLRVVSRVGRHGDD